MARLKTDIAVSALIRRAQSAGAFAAIVRRGDGDAGAYLAVTRQYENDADKYCLLYTSPSPRDGLLSRMPSSA